MIAEGLFNAQINRAARILRGLDLLEKQEYFPNRNVEGGLFRRLSYREHYDMSIREVAYDFILIDQSLIHFNKHGDCQHNGGLNYAYLDCPVNVKPYKEFVADWLEIGPEIERAAELLEEWGDSLRSEYDLYINSCDSKPVTPIRYDFAPDQYNAGRHPVSHLHFGFDTEIRIATKKVLRPISFVLLIVRQRYPKKWEDFLKKDKKRVICREIRECLDAVHEDFWNEPDVHELVLE